MGPVAMTLMPRLDAAGGYILALVASLLAFTVRYFAGETMGGLPFVTFFLAILSTAVLAGWRPALFCLALSFPLAWYFFLPPYNSFSLEGGQTAVALGFFLLVSGTQILSLGILQRALRRLRAREAEIDALLGHQRRLYHELQHRVSNGIQLVASTLAIQAAQAGDDETEALLTAAAERLRGVAEVHYRLYDPDLADGRLAEALEGLVRQLLDSAGLTDVALEMAVDAPPLGQNHATMVAMIVAEAASNAMKHAFAGREGGRLQVALRRATPGRLLLTVRDDGPGPGAAPETPSLGMTIMQGFAQRLGGTLRLAHGVEGGAELSLEFHAEAPA